MAHAFTIPGFLTRQRWCLIAALTFASVTGCAGTAQRGTRSVESAPVDIRRAEAALIGQDGPQAIVLFRRFLAQEDLKVEARAKAYPGLARAHELVGDYPAAIRAYEAVLALEAGTPEDRADWLSRKGANEAEIERWAASASSFARADETIGAAGLPSMRVEFHARRALAQFAADDLDACVATLDAGDAIYEAAVADDTERFSTFYFVGMLRFYRGAVIHARFRAIEVSLPETQMAKDFEAKLELLVAAQEAYNSTIATKHVYWVSAAGFQLGHMFEELYDSLMHAPVPDWLDERQRRVYYEELKEQLRPVVNKAIWVFERNLEAARRLGYETEFTEESEAALARLQSILLSGDTALGQPHPQLAPIEGADGPGLDPQQDQALPGPERKLFLPTPTPL